MNENQKISMGKKIAYGCGAGGGNVMSTLLASFLLSYSTDTAGIAAAAVGTMFVICRLLDGVTDFAMGGIVDKTNTKIGKARPWLIICAPLMVIGIILILSVPQGLEPGRKISICLHYIYFPQLYRIYHLWYCSHGSAGSYDQEISKIVTRPQPCHPSSTIWLVLLWER